MKLINADVLKDFAYINKGNFNTVEGIREWIDNAPTVEERPQGEWIEHTDGYFTVYTCNKCNGIVGENYKFCGHCGAEKKKGGAE